MSHLQAFSRALRGVFGERLVTLPEQLLTYECDGQKLSRSRPDAVVYPESTDEVAAAVRICNDHAIPFLARGAGTGLSGGAVAVSGGLIIETARMSRLLAVDLPNRLAVVQPGLVNAHLSRATSPLGYFFAPDPSSQSACTIGGNIAENSGGPHTLKYGVTTNHVLALVLVLGDGQVVRTGSATGDAPGYDLTGAFIGSEGTFGVATEATVRLLPSPEGVRTFLGIYDSVAAASDTVSGILAAGIVPAAIELMDSLAIQAVEAHLEVGLPTDAEAVLLLELEGLEGEIEVLAAEVERLCRDHGARELRRAEDEEARRRLWKGRKLALGAVGKIAKAYYTHDGVVPRSRLAEALGRIRAIAGRHRLRIANVCHAGDGNLHPLLLYDPADRDEAARVRDAGAEILRMCVELGGTLTGEHGIGIEKQACLPWLFSDDDLDQMRRVREALDPTGLSNPAKVFPTGAGCGELAPARPVKTGGWL